MRAIATAVTLVALLVSESSARVVRPRHEVQFRAPAHSQCHVDMASAKRPLSLVQQKSLFTVRAALLPTLFRVDSGHHVARIDLRLAPPLPPARMRYRRTVHDADGEPPA